VLLLIKFNHSVANLLAFHTSVTMTKTKALHQMQQKGHVIDMAALATFSPYHMGTSIASGGIRSTRADCRNRWNIIISIGLSPEDVAFLLERYFPEQKLMEEPLSIKEYYAQRREIVALFG
jgi:hypothetical protein